LAGSIDVTSKITGVVPAANLGSGTASSSTYLAGDSTYKTITTGTSWQSVETGSTMTAVAGNGYPINTTSNACTVTLPAGSVGDTIELVDYAGTWDTNGITLTADGSEKIKGSTDDLILDVERQGIKIVYVDATQGWVAATGVNETAPALQPLSYSTDFVVIAGGGGASNDRAGGGGAGGYRASYNNEASGGGNTSETALTLSVGSGTVYTVTVGAGGAGNSSGSTPGGDGGASSITGSDITDITTVGGGGGADRTTEDGSAGGSGGGASNDASATGGAGTAEQGYAGGDNDTSDGETCGGGGGAGAVGYKGAGNSDPTRGVGGAGVASTITGSSVTYAGGGGGGGQSNTAAGGAGGGGTGGDNGTDGTNGSANTGSGGGGGGNGSTTGGTGGDGVVILRMADARYSGTTTGSPTVATDVGGSGETTITFTGDGSYTA
jgi:hypothetical protein